MKTLERLVEMVRLDLEQKRRTVNDLEAMRQGFADRIISIDNEIAHEMRSARTDPLLTDGLGRFIQTARDRQVRLRESLAEVDRQLEFAREQVTEAFQEKKRYEIVLERRRLERRKAADRREQLRLDEIGLRRAMRQRAP
ncbi:flagellar FliJ family protein [Minwuia thermotolerans]|uniref:Flagellar FliJ protein n=1 Tax=Minwuia thermotolerans TaxID=2056226 RepID=A0A2M9FZ53_9PROT|nr:flagellar FliJ family protein [Minwuia thermotolerans]PJK28747.1 hypothetical protein CVT23_15545 [Minwuia thermotolerans]